MPTTVKTGQWFEAGQEGIGPPRLCVMRRGDWVWYQDHGEGRKKRMMAASVGETFSTYNEAIDAHYLWLKHAQELQAEKDRIHARFRDELRMLRNRYKAGIL